MSTAILGAQMGFLIHIGRSGELLEGVMLKMIATSDKQMKVKLQRYFMSY
jgi:hypothetical protein